MDDVYEQPFKLSEPLSPEEVNAIVRGYTDKQLAENHREAAKLPGTTWHLLLSAEIRRRGL